MKPLCNVIWGFMVILWWYFPTGLQLLIHINPRYFTNVTSLINLVKNVIRVLNITCLTYHWTATLELNTLALIQIKYQIEIIVKMLIINFSCYMFLIMQLIFVFYFFFLQSNIQHDQIDWKSTLIWPNRCLTAYLFSQNRNPLYILYDMGEYKQHKTVFFFSSFHLPLKYIEWFLYINAVKMYILWESFIAKLEQFRNIYLHVYFFTFRVKSRRSLFYVYIIRFYI